jgi:hypothetical protein
MHTTAANRISPSRKVTPDMVGQRLVNSGFVVEVKASVPENEDYRRQKLIDVQKYDDDLIGWSSEIQSHDVILLVDYPNSQVVKQDIEALMADGRFTANRPFSLVYFGHQPRADATWIALHLILGRISDGAKQIKLERICMIHPENVQANPHFGAVLLYDAMPPLPLLMIRLYEAITSNLNEDEYLRLRTEGQLSKTLTLAEMKEMLADYCCPEQTDSRVPKLPQTAWIKAALAMWVQMGWAIKSPNAHGCYDVVVKKTRREPFEQFLKVSAEADCKAERKREKEAIKKKQVDEKFRQKYPLLAFGIEAKAEKENAEPAAPPVGDSAAPASSPTPKPDGA